MYDRHSPYKPLVQPHNIAPQIHVPNRSNEQLRVMSLILRESNHYCDPYYRPYQTQINHSAAELFQSSFEDMLHVSPQSIAGFANNLIRPAAEVRGAVPIGEGWGTKRFIFLLEIEVNRWGGRTEIISLTGYTDYLGASRSGALDPQMRLYFTNYVTAHITTDNMGVGLQQVHRVSDVSQIIYDNPWRQNNFHNHNNIITLRPNDIFAKMQANSFGGVVEDLRGNYPQTSSSDGFKFSKAINSNAPNYISKIVSNLKTSIDAQDGVGNDWATTLGMAASGVSEYKVRSDMVFKTFVDRTDFSTGKSVMIADLTDLTPHLNQITDVVFNKAEDLYNSQNTQRWNGSDYETIFASTLGHAVPAIMMECFIRSVSFIAHNNTINCDWIFEIDGIPHGFAKSIDLSMYLQRLQHRIITEVLQSLMPGYYVPVTLHITCDVARDTVIWVQYNGGPNTPFVNPSFANNLTSPVVTDNVQDLELITADMETLCTSVGLNEPQDPTGNSHGVNFLP